MQNLIAFAEKHQLPHELVAHVSGGLAALNAGMHNQGCSRAERRRLVRLLIQSVQLQDKKMSNE